MKYYYYGGSRRLIICRSICNCERCSGAAEIPQEGVLPLTSHLLLVGRGWCCLALRIVLDAEHNYLQAAISHLLATQVFEQKIPSLSGTKERFLQVCNQKYMSTCINQMLYRSGSRDQRRTRSPSSGSRKANGWGEEYEEDPGVSPPRGAPVQTLNSRYQISLTSKYLCQDAKVEEVQIPISFTAPANPLGG